MYAHTAWPKGSSLLGREEGLAVLLCMMHSRTARLAIAYVLAVAAALMTCYGGTHVAVQRAGSRTHSPAGAVAPLLLAGTLPAGSWQLQVAAATCKLWVSQQSLLPRWQHWLNMDRPYAQQRGWCQLLACAALHEGAG
jgi:hypothetical protein